MALSVLENAVLPGTPYRLFGRLGGGGQGNIYEVEHVELRQVRALKLLGPDEDAERMRAEWRALGAVKHHNIVQILETGRTAEGVPFFVMEKLDGMTVARRVDHEGRFEIREAIRIATGVLAGLEAAHAAGIVHRDIKPSNVFLTASGEVKVLDFGLAKVADTAITRSDTIVGSPRYMAPEQVFGEPVDARTDLYGVGLLLFEMLAGKPPFETTGGADQVMAAHAHERAPRVRTVAPTVPRWLDELAACALAKDPADRPQSAAEMRGALERGGAGKLPKRWVSVAVPLAVTVLGLGVWWRWPRVAPQAPPAPVVVAMARAPDSVPSAPIVIAPPPSPGPVASTIPRKSSSKKVAAPADAGITEPFANAEIDHVNHGDPFLEAH